MPVRDAAATLGATLRSIRCQSEPDFECVLVDDGSSDGSLAIARAFAALDPRFRVVSRTAEGLVAALNAGLSLCRGSYVARMDADDLMHRHRLRDQKSALRADATLWGVGSHVRIFPRRSLSEGRREYELWLNSLSDPESVAQNAFVECPLAHPTWMLRREVLARHPYRDMGWPEDYDLILRLLEVGGRLSVAPAPPLFWRDAPLRTSRVSPIYAQERFIACKAHFIARAFLRDARSYVLWGYGDTGRALCRALLTEGKSPSAILELHPGRIGQRILGVPVLHRDRAAELRSSKMIVSVAGREARADIRARLSSAGFVERQDFIIAA